MMKNYIDVIVQIIYRECIEYTEFTSPSQIIASALYAFRFVGK